MAFPGIYRAKAVALNGSSMTAYIPQVFGDSSVIIEDFVGTPAGTGMGWVVFHGGNPEMPVWMSAIAVTNGDGGTGTPGPAGPSGPTGATGPSGAAGATGPPGVGIPTGGTANQILTKVDSTNYNAQWTNPAAISAVPPTRVLGTTAPLTGGGDLSIDRTLAVATFAGTTAGVVPTSPGGSTSFLRADGTWAVPPGSVTGVPTTRSVTTTAPLAGGGTLATDLSLTIAAASTTLVGATRLATTAEATAQTLATVAVTPAGLADRFKTSGGTLTGALTAPGLTVTGASTMQGITIGVGAGSITVDTVTVRNAPATGTDATNKTYVDTMGALFTNTLKGTVPASGGGTTNYLRADGTWAVPPAPPSGIFGINVREQSVLTGSTLTSLNFGAAFDTSVTGAEATITLDLSEYTGANLLPNAMVAGLGTLATKSTITTAEITDGTVSNTDLATMAANTFKGNNTGLTAAPQDVTLANLKTALAVPVLPVAVTDGGTGRNTATAYGLIAAGITATGVQQSVAPAASGFLKTTAVNQLPAWTVITESDVSNLTTDLAARLLRTGDTMTAGSLTFAVSIGGVGRFGQHLGMWGPSYGIGVQTNNMYFRVSPGAGYRFYSGGAHSDTAASSGGGSELFNITDLSTQYKGRNLASELYVQSRGTNLVTNGDGLLLNNTNFSTFTYDTTESYVGSGSFSYDGASSAREIDELIPVDPNQRYKFSYAIKQMSRTVFGDVPTHYGYVACYDADRLSIQAYHVMKVPGSALTTLAVPLNPGNTTITLTSAAGWHSGATGHMRSLAVYTYLNSQGYQYPAYTYTRNIYIDMWDAGAISGNVITLRVPWAGPAYAAGRQVANAQSGGTYDYIAGVNTPTLPNVWTVYTGTIGKWESDANYDPTVTPVPSTTGAYISPSGFRHGTAFAKTGWLLSYPSPGSPGAMTGTARTVVDGVTLDSIQQSADRYSFTALSPNPPFTVASNVVVTNLNADLLDGVDGTGFIKTNGGGTITAGNLNLIPTTGGNQITFGSRIGQHILLSGTDHGIGVQGAGTGDTVYNRSPNAFYWYKGGVHAAGQGVPGGGVSLLSLRDDTFLYLTNRIWHEGNQGHHAGPPYGPNADMLDGHHSTDFAAVEVVEALLGDLLYVGTYDAASYNPLDPATKPTPDWDDGPTVYRHGMYWVLNSRGTLDFLDSDYSGRYDPTVDQQKSLSNGDWIIATDPDFDPDDPAHDQDAPHVLADMLFQFIEFSSETYVKEQIGLHTDPVVSPDPHSMYFNMARGDIRYAQKNHTHKLEMRQFVIDHVDANAWGVASYQWDSTTGLVTLSVPKSSTDLYHNILPLGTFDLANVHPLLNKKWPVYDTETSGEVVRFLYGVVPDVPALPTGLQTLSPTGTITNDPHARYLDRVEGDAFYAKFDHDHNLQYEPKGLVAFHEGQSDPHVTAGYLKKETADALFLTELEGKDLFAPKDHSHPEIIELHPTDGAASADIWVGSVEPTSTMGLAVGDLWFSTNNISQVLPTVRQLTSVTNGATGISVSVAWDTWPASELVDAILLERSLTGAAPWTTVQTTLTPNPYIDTSVTANTLYYYRISAHNSRGYSPTSTTKSIVTKPVNPTGVLAETTGPTNASVKWTTVAGYTYVVFVNGVSVGTRTTPYSHPGVTENTTYTFGVQATSTIGSAPFQTSATILSAITSLNAPPPNISPVPTLPSKTHNTATMTWTAAAVAGLDDFKDYQILLDGVATGVYTTALSYTFTGLAASTSYDFGVKARDTRNALSVTEARVTPKQSTNAAPDTTPPPAPSISSFKPEGSYGNFVVRWNTFAADVYQYRVDRSSDNVNWTIDKNWTAKGSVVSHDFTVSYANASPWPTIYCRVYVRDAALNVNYVNAPPYDLIASPAYITADATNHWRPTNGGQYNAVGNSRVIQGYYSDVGYNGVGMWYYGSKPNTVLYYGGRRTIVSGKIWIGREDGGAGVPLPVTMYEHLKTANPGTVTGRDPTLSAELYNATTISGYDLQWNGPPQSIPLPTTGGQTWADDLVKGTPYKGIALRTTTKANYMTISNLTEDPNSGRLEIHHLG